MKTNIKMKVILSILILASVVLTFSFAGQREAKAATIPSTEEIKFKMDFSFSAGDTLAVGDQFTLTTRLESSSGNDLSIANVLDKIFYNQNFFKVVSFAAAKHDSSDEMYMGVMAPFPDGAIVSVNRGGGYVQNAWENKIFDWKPEFKSPFALSTVVFEVINTTYNSEVPYIMSDITQTMALYNKGTGYSNISYDYYGRSPSDTSNAIQIPIGAPSDDVVLGDLKVTGASSTVTPTGFTGPVTLTDNNKSYSTTLTSANHTLTPSLTITTSSGTKIDSVKVGGAPIVGSSGTYQLTLPDAASTVTATVSLKSQSGTATHTFQVSVTGAGYSTASLASVTFSAPDSTLTPTLYANATDTNSTTFSSGVYTYYLRLSSKTTNIDVTPTITPGQNIQNTVLVNGAQVASGSSTAVTGKPSTITVRATAQNGTVKDYTFQVSYLSDDTDINGVIVNGSTSGTGASGTLITTNYDSGTKTYTAASDISFKNTSFTIKANLKSGQKVKIDGTLTSTATATINFTQTAREVKTIDVEVISESGQIATYKVVVARKAASTNAKYGTITVNANGGSNLPGSWNGNTYTLTDPLDYSSTITGLNIYLTAEDPNATVTYNNSVHTSSVFITFTNNQISASFVITAEDGTTRVTYTVVANMTPPETDSSIDSSSIVVLDANNQVLSGSWDANGRIYTISPEVPFANKTVTIKVTYNGQYATMTIDGSATDSGVFSNPINVPKNISIVVTAQDKTATTYTVKVAQETADTNAAISSITMTGATNQATYSPSASSTAVKFVFELPSASGHQGTINLTLSSAKAKAQIKTATGSFGDFNSGTIYTTATSLVLRVIAESGTYLDYEILINKLDERSSNTTMGNLSVSGLNMTDSYGSVTVFNTSITDYYLTVPYTTTQIDINASAVDSKATIPGAKTGTQSLNVGINDFTYQVKAEDGSLSPYTYTLHVTRSAGRTGNFLLTLSMNGKAVDGFNQYATGYTLRVERNISTAAFTYTYSDGATVTQRGPSSLTVSNANTYYIDVTSETNVTNTYTIVVYRAENIYSIDDLLIYDDITNALAQSVSGGNFTFNLTTYTYTFQVPYSVSKISFEIDTPAAFAVFSQACNGTKSLSVGNNNFDVYIESEYGSLASDATCRSRTYKINVVRATANTDTSLSSLSVIIGGQEYITNFSPTVYTYTIPDLSGQLYTANVTATPTALTSKVTGNVGSNVSIDLGVTTSKTLVITVTAESGATIDYQVLVSKQAIVLNSDNSIVNISVVGNDSVDYFAAQTVYSETIYNYRLTVPASITTITILVTLPTAAGSTATGAGVFQLQIGTQDFVVYATAQNGTKGSDYTITIERDSYDTDNELSGIKIDGVTIPGFSSSNINYTYNVPNSTTQLNISATTSGTNATIKTDLSSPFGLAVGENTITITVAAEDGSIKNYTILVIRDAVARLETLEVEDQEIDPVFDPEHLSYTVTLPYEKTQANVIATVSAANVNNLTVTGTGIVNINPGETKNVRIVVRTKSGENNTTYTVSITREIGNADNYLTSLQINGTDLEGFSSYVYNYTIVLPHTTTDFTLHGECSDGATIQYPTDLTLALGKNEKIIRVTSQTGVTREYKLTIYRANNDMTINDIKLQDKTGTPLKDADGNDYAFDATQTNITITVPYKTDVINVNVLKADTYAIVTGAGDKSLSVGSNSITVYVTSEYGKYNPTGVGVKSPEYIYTIIREQADTDNKLSDLVIKVNGQLINLSERFDPDTLGYAIKVDDDVSSINISATANSSKATVTGIGNIPLNTGGITGTNAYVHTITVTAEDGTTREYKVSIYRDDVDMSKDNSIESISVSSGADYFIGITSENPTVLFDKEKLEYKIILPFNVTNYLITVRIPALSPATVYGNGTFTIAAGETKTHDIYATNDIHEEGTHYKIIVEAPIPATDNSLKDILIDNILIDGFDPTKFTYNISYPNNVDSIFIDASTKDATAKIIAGLGEKKLNVGDNLVTIEVVAQNGVKQNYILIINRAEPLPKLLSLGVNGYSLCNAETGKVMDFDPNIYEYSLKVSYNVVSVEVFATCSDSKVSITGTGERDLEVGMNDLVVSLISVKGDIVTYTIHVKRLEKASVNTEITEITILEIPEFKNLYTNDQTVYYANVDEKTSFELPNIIKKLNVSVTVSNQGDEETDPATYEVYNTNLSIGESVVLIVVTAADGVTTRNVIIHVKRQSMKYEVVPDAYTEIECVTSTDGLEYNVDLKGQNLSDFDFTKYVKAEQENVEVKVLTTTENKPNEVIVEVTNGEETSTIKFVVSGYNESIMDSFNIYYIIAFIVVILLLVVIAIYVSKDKFGRIIKKRR